MTLMLYSSQRPGYWRNHNMAKLVDYLTDKSACVTAAEICFVCQVFLYEIGGRS